MTLTTCHGRVDEATTATATGTTTAGTAGTTTTTVLEAYFPDDASSFYSEREDAQEDDDELDSDTITSSFFDEMDELEETLYSTSDALAEAVSSHKLAVGKPSVRPRASPGTTVPANENGRSSRAAAVVRSPAWIASRMRELLTGAPS